MLDHIRRCPICSCELGPFESGARCLTCRTRPSLGVRLIFPRPSLTDRAVAALERSEKPLASWDIQRLVDRGRQDKTHLPTLSSQLGADRRFCWAGRGIYGLYRHGLLPGARDLHEVGLFYLFASEQPLHTDELCFVIRYVGYRFSDASLVSAITRYRSPIERDGDGRWFVDTTKPESTGFMTRLIELKSGDVFNAVLYRTAAQVKAGLKEMDRRRRAVGDIDRTEGDSAGVLGKRGKPKSGEPKVFAWPRPPACEYFETGIGRVSRVRRRAIAIVEGRSVEPYVADIKCRDQYLEACMQAYRLLVSSADT